MAPVRTMLAGKCRLGFALMLVVHVYSRELPILPGPWEDTVASPCLTRPGPRVSRAVSHWAHCFSRSTGSTLSLPPDRKPHPSQLCSVHGAGAAASKGGRDSIQPHSNAKCVTHQNPGTSTKPSLMYSEFLKPETHVTLKHWCGLKFLSQKWDLKKVTILRAGNPQHHSLPWLYFFSRPSPIKTRSPQTRFHVSVSPG